MITRVGKCLVLCDMIVGKLPIKHDWQYDSGDSLDSTPKTDLETERLQGGVQGLEHAAELIR